ncbi:MAG TPA: hypothetical protein VGK59_18585 [Ohtaekwangia sp.]
MFPKHRVLFFMTDPAFLFYPGDYLRDTQCLSEQAQVAYDRIMCEHMRNICITQAQLDFFTKRLTADQKSELMMILRPVNNGFCIPWVVDSITKRREYSESRRKNRESKGKKESPKAKNISSTYVPHMENEIVIEDEIENKLKGAFDEIYLEAQKMKWPHLDFMFEFRTFCEKVRGSPDHYANHDTSGLRLALQSQLRNSKGKVNGHSKNGKQSTEELATAFALRVQQDAASKQFSGGG